MATTEISPPGAGELPERLFGTIEDDRFVYDVLKELMMASQHGQRWDARDFDDDPHELLRIDRAFLAVAAGGRWRDKPVATWGEFLVPEASKANLQNGIREVYERAAVREHLEGKGSLAFLLVPHISYADVPTAATLAAQLGPDFAANQTAFIHRQVVLDELRLNKGTTQEQRLKVIDDGLLLASNIIQTLPESQSGQDDRLAPYREAINKPALGAYQQLLEKGGQTFWIAASGTEAKHDAETGDLIVGRVGKNTARLFFLFNGNGADKVMTIPFVIELDPFTAGPHEVPFEFGEGDILHSAGEIHTMMEEGTASANRIKRPETPNFRYETAEAYKQRLS